jgi:Chaperone of endosialidase
MSRLWEEDKTMKRLSLLLTRAVFAASCLGAAWGAEAGFSGTDVFLPAVARANGNNSSAFYTTLLATNVSSSAVNIQVRFYVRDQSNTSPATYSDTIQPGETTGGGFGVAGSTSSAAGAGVLGTNASGAGVRGSSTGSGAGVEGNGLGSGPAGLFSGRVQVTTLAGSGNRAVYSDASGNLTNTSCDARLKRDVADLAAEVDVLDALSRLRGVAFNWNTSVERAKTLGDQREIGFLAQEVEAVLPHVVGTHADGHKSVDYAKLTAFLIEVAKAQQAEIDALGKEMRRQRR